MVTKCCWRDPAAGQEKTVSVQTVDSRIQEEPRRQQPLQPPKAPKSARRNKPAAPSPPQQRPSSLGSNHSDKADKATTNYEEECDRRLKAVPVLAAEDAEDGLITDLTAASKSNNESLNRRGRVTFTDQSQVHEIPPKPKRTRNQEKRSRSAPTKLTSSDDNAVVKPSNAIVAKDVGDVTTVDAGQDHDAVVCEEKSEAVDLCQRASMTSLEDLKAKHVPEKDIEALNKVKWPTE